MEFLSPDQREDYFSINLGSIEKHKKVSQTKLPFLWSSETTECAHYSYTFKVSNRILSTKNFKDKEELFNFERHSIWLPHCKNRLRPLVHYTGMYITCPLYVSETHIKALDSFF